MRRAALAALVLVVAVAAIVLQRLPGRDPATRPAGAKPRAVAHPTRALAVLDADEPAGLRVEVLEALRLAPGIVEVRLALGNRDAARALVLGDRLAESPAEAGTLSAAFLETERGTVRYYVLRDPQGVPSCSDGLQSLAPGERRPAWIRFVSPGPAAARLTLHLKGLPPIEGIPLDAAS